MPSILDLRKSKEPSEAPPSSKSAEGPSKSLPSILSLRKQPEMADEEIADSGFDVAETASVPQQETGFFAKWAEEFQKAQRPPPNLTQIGLGALKGVTFPQDLIRTTVELMPEGGLKDFLRKKYPSQEEAEVALEQLSGLQLRPQSELEKLTRSAAELGTLTPTKAGLNLGQQLSRRAQAGILGGAVERASEPLLEKAGVPEEFAKPIAGLAGGATAGLRGLGGKVQGKVSPEVEAARETAKEFGLRRPKVAEIEPSRKIGKPVAFPNSIEQVKKEIGSTTLKAVEDRISKERPGIPAKFQSFDDAYESLYAEGKANADKVAAPISTYPWQTWIKERIGEMEAKTANLSDADKKVLKIMKDDLATFESKPEITARQAINQKEANNANRKNLYKTPEFSGAKRELDSYYAGLNNAIFEGMERQGLGKEIVNPIREGDKFYHAERVFENVENKLSPIIDRDNNTISVPKLKKALEGKTGKEFRRDLGDSTARDLYRIANTQQSALKGLEKIDPLTVQNLIQKEWKWLAAAKLIPGAGTLVKAVRLPLKAINLVRGEMLLRDGIRQEYEGFLKGLAKGSVTEAKRFASQMKKHLESEVGSIDDLLDEGD